VTTQSPTVDFSKEQAELWSRVAELWAMARNRDERQIRSSLHPDYVGWDMSTPLPHKREASVRSVCGAAELGAYELCPWSVQIYEDHVGVVHYSYSAKVSSPGAPSPGVTGKWSEVYLKHGGVWTLIAVSGRPDP
jgi:hypothetical protein